MFKEFFDLQSSFDEECRFPTILNKSEQDKTTRERYRDILTHTIAEATEDNRLVPLLGDFVGIPLECNLNEIEILLSDIKEPEKDFFEVECSCKKETQKQTDFLTAGGGQLERKTTNKKPEISEDSKECNVDQYILDRVSAEILSRKTEVSWEDVAGLEGLKKNIKEIIIWPMLRPDIFKGLRGPPKGLLLFGPPGTGKTMIGKCIAAQCEATFFTISASSLTSKWVGEGEKMVRALFYLAKKNQPSVIFIDEIDSLLSQRSENENEGSRRIKTEFLIQFDGTRSGEEDRILVIGATNRPQEIDEAARRRLVKRVYVPLPDESARSTIIRNLIKQFNNKVNEEDLQEITVKTNGYSGSDMFNLCREASMEPLREIEDIRKIEYSETRPIKKEDFLKAMKQIKKSVSEDDLKGYKKWNEEFGSC